MFESLRRNLNKNAPPPNLEEKPIVKNLLSTPASAEESRDVTPVMSALPSCANLITLEAQAAKAQGDNLIQRQLSLPAPAKAKTTVKNILMGLLRLPLLLLLLYFFICSLDLLSTGFRLIAGKAAGTDTNEIFRH